MRWKDQAALAMFALFLVAFCLSLASAWPILLSHLNWANWSSLLLVHLSLLLSMLNLYFKALKEKVVQRMEVLLAAGLALMASSFDLSLIWQICGR